MFRPLTTRQVVVDLVLAGAYVVVAPALDRFVLGYPGGLRILAVAVLFAGALAVRRRSPAIALGVAWAAAIGQMVLLQPPGMVDTAVFAVLYVTAAYGSRLLFWLGLVSAVVGSAIATGFLFFAPLGQFRLDPAADRVAVVLLLLLLALGLSWTVGVLVRVARRGAENRMARVRAEAEAVAEAQRVRIARDMHDVVAHSLAVVIAQADGARYTAATDPAAAPAALATIAATARSALTDVRLLLTQLRHSQGDGPVPGLADVDDLFGQVRAAGVDLRVDIDPTPPAEPSAAVQLAVFRILQEALTNALRHGDGGPVRVDLAWQADRVELGVRNGLGAGAAPGPDRAPDASAGHGLIGMRERALLVGGTMTVQADHREFRLWARLPVAPAG